MSRLLITFALAWIFSVQASAALVYELTFSQTNVAAAVGQNFSLDILFREIATGGDTHRLDLGLLGTNGLLNANFSVTNNGPGAGIITSLVGNNLFDLFGGPDVNGVDPLVTVEQDIDLLSNPVFATSETPVAGGTMRSVQVGSLSLTASNMVGQSNVFQLADFGLGDDFTIDNGFGDLSFIADGVMSFGSVTVTAVPEPSSLVLLGIAGLIGGNRLRRLRKVSEPKNVSPTTAS